MVFCWVFSPLLVKIKFLTSRFLHLEEMNQTNSERNEPDEHSMQKCDGETSETSSFAKLFELARQGDKKAIGELIDRWRKYLLLIANENLDRDLHAKIAPSDIVQQSMIDAQLHIGDFRGNSEAEFRAWVRTILRNNVHAARRRFKTAQRRDLSREICINDSAMPIPTLKNPHDSPRTTALKNERAHVLDSAMKQLPENYQQVIKLRNWDELSFVDIAQRMDSTEDSARKLWSRAVLRLQQVINQEHPGFQSGVSRKSNR